MLAQEYWNGLGSTKEFEDPLYLDKLSPHLTQQSQILEYGCGYGRILQLLKSKGYNNLTGFDFSSSMIKRGKAAYPDLDLRLLAESGKIPRSDESADLVILSTVLVNIVDKQEQAQLFAEILRVLKKKALLYISDFLINDHPKYQEKYRVGFQQFGEWGVYKTTENLAVRHHTSRAIMELLSAFDIQWFEQFDFKTMNQNAARTFHCIASK
jgi:ubiquinone/menaquinone biosynthesis C-methylase UbiE